MSEKTYPSIFVPEIKIDISNYLTELLISNYISFTKGHIPNCPFWRKAIAKGNRYLEGLGQRYVIELAHMRNLLLVFAPGVIAKYIKESKCVCIKLAKKENQEKHMYNLVGDQVKYVKGLQPVEKVKPVHIVEEDIKMSETPMEVDVTTFFGKEPNKELVTPPGNKSAISL